MPAAVPSATPDDTAHLRGVRVAATDSGRVITVLSAVVLLVLVASAVALTVSAAGQNARLSNLRHHGVPVQATVTGCLGISSGVGMGIEYWECRGTYALGGHTYDEMIRGSRALLQPGQTVQAIAVAGEPTLLSTPAAAAENHSPWTPYITPMVLAAVAVLGALGLVVWSIRRRRQVRAGGDGPGPAVAESDIPD
jgi:hypothetical protein